VIQLTFTINNLAVDKSDLLFYTQKFAAKYWPECPLLWEI